MNLNQKEKAIQELNKMAFEILGQPKRSETKPWTTLTWTCPKCKMKIVYKYFAVVHRHMVAHRKLERIQQKRKEMEAKT